MSDCRQRLSISMVPDREKAKTTSRTGRLLRQTGILFTLLPLYVMPPSPVGAEEYMLGPQDKVRIKIYEWRASRDVIFEWGALNDTFTVGADGRLSLPFAGPVQAADRSPEDVAMAIGESLMRNMGLGRRPDASVEVVDFRPFYILGHVSEPGEFPYRPGLTVLQALSIAGGLRTSEQDLANFRREIIRGRGDISLLGLEEIGLLARMARLKAELARSDSITFPDRLVRNPDDQVIVQAMEQEQLIFEARNEAISTQVRALENLRNFLKQELVSLTTQLGFLDKQIALIKQERDSVSSLVAKGLAPAPREMSLERALAEIQSERLTAETSLLRTQQEISRTDVTILELRNQRANDITLALRQTQSELDALERRTQTALHLLHESETQAPQIAANLAGTDTSDAIYTIVRPTEDGTVILTATESTPVRPGDTVKVDIPMPAGAQTVDAEQAQSAGLPESTAAVDF